MIKAGTILETARELNINAAIEIPKDVQQKVEQLAAEETHHLSHYVLGKILENYDAAIKDRRPMCADTGLPRYYAKIGNDAVIEGGSGQPRKGAQTGNGGYYDQYPLTAQQGTPTSQETTIITM